MPEKAQLQAYLKSSVFCMPGAVTSSTCLHSALKKVAGRCITYAPKARPSRVHACPHSGFPKHTANALLKFCLDVGNKRVQCHLLHLHKACVSPYLHRAEAFSQSRSLPMWYLDVGDVGMQGQTRDRMQQHTLVQRWATPG
eukprot:scaffold228494_cov27-Tisochrysis_lutea.AAC.1